MNITDKIKELKLPYKMKGNIMVQQGARASAIIFGISLTLTGLITSIINAPKQR